MVHGAAIRSFVRSFVRTDGRTPSVILTHLPPFPPNTYTNHQDHKPNKPSELERVKKLGGTVRWYGLLEQDGSPMEGMGVYRINGNLAVARAIGDRSERPFVSAEADVKTFPADEEGDEFIILASDGLWDVMSSEEAVEVRAWVGCGRGGGLGGVCRPSLQLMQIHIRAHNECTILQFVHNVMSAHVGALTEGGTGGSGEGGGGGQRPGG